MRVNDGIRSEVRQLPLMLGKLIGCILAVVGFGGLVYVSTRPPKPAVLSIIVYAIAGIAGIAVFIVCVRIMSSRADSEVLKAARRKTPGSKVLPWIILLALAVVFVIIMLLI